MSELYEIELTLATPEEVLKYTLKSTVGSLKLYFEALNHPSVLHGASGGGGLLWIPFETNILSIAYLATLRHDSRIISIEKQS